MAKFRKKPVVIEARKLTLQTITSINLWLHENGVEGRHWSKPPMRAVVGLVIPTLEGDHQASFGDWIIQGVNGEFYPCKPDIFEKTYEAVAD